MAAFASLIQNRDLDSFQYPLQHLVWPTAETAEKYALYITAPSASVIADASGILHLKEGQSVELCSFFNAFSHKKWHSIASIEDMYFSLCGSGTVCVRLKSWTKTCAAVLLFESHIELSNNGFVLHIPNIKEIPGEVLGVEIEAVSAHATLIRGEWFTTQKPQREVKTLAVITTFKRETAVKKAIERFKNHVIAVAPANTVGLLVVDNGNTLNIPPEILSGTGVRIVSNENLGGAGGFTRGLYEAIEEQHWTHCLFMDDDASCEPESVFRAAAVASFAVDSKSAVAGAMFYTDRPTVQHEKGAFFTRKHTDKKILTALSHNTDLAQRVSVANNDLPDKANYGGWWFFMFPISEVTFWPFPFFVRGDDTDFSLSNQFHIVTLNGICSWAENFIHKITPSVSYLAYRSWLALSFMHNTHAHIRFSFRILLRTALSFGIKHHYGSMHAVLNAGFDALKGPSYFAEHPNPLTRIAEFKPYDQSYQASPSDIASMAITQQKNTISHKWLRIFSPNALFLPSCSIAKQPVHTDFYAKKSHRLCLNKATYGFGEGDRIRFYPKSFRVFIKELKRLLILFFVFYKEYKKTFAVYQRDTKIYKTRSYWEKFYQTTNAADKISQKIQ